MQLSGDENDQSSTEYLVALFNPTDAEADFHLIPVQELQASDWVGAPEWLSFIGVQPGQS